MPKRDVAAPPFGDGSCVSAAGEVRGERVRAPGDASAAAGSKTGDCANEGRLFMNCINLENPEGNQLRVRCLPTGSDGSAAAFRSPLRWLAVEDRWAGRPARASLAKPIRIGNRNRSARPLVADAA
jgi:hypothetical protein